MTPASELRGGTGSHATPGPTAPGTGRLLAQRARALEGMQPRGPLCSVSSPFRRAPRVHRLTLDHYGRADARRRTPGACTTGTARPDHPRSDGASTDTGRGP